jgi:hypothetical protein
VPLTSVRHPALSLAEADARRQPDVADVPLQIVCSRRSRARSIEIDRPFVDFQGYDLVATYGAVVRHIQLKGSRGGQLAIHRRLAAKASACVVNLVSRVTPDGTRIEFD